jgi:putative ABC transport system permease protein
VNALENLKMALRALRTHRLRSLLTILGIVIGVASIAAMIAVGMGAQQQILEQIQSLGANLLMVAPAQAEDRNAPPRLVEDDAAAIAAEVPYVRVASPSVRAAAQLIRGNRDWRTTVNGTTLDYFVAREWPVITGRYFSEAEQRAAAKVVLLGRTVADELFGDSDPIGAEIRIDAVPFSVIGVLGDKGASATGRNQDDVAFVPIATAKQRLGIGHRGNRGAVDYILVKAVSADTMALAGEQIEARLRQRHRTRADQRDHFRISDPAAAMEAQREAGRTIAWLLGAVASISLAVGGISIMNIMLVSVTERTREIGIRMAVGARPRDVRNQFLIEAVTLCLLGGLLGVLLGAAAAVIIALMTGWPVYIGPQSLLLSIGFAAAVGVFFGYYPARQASRMDPIEALRFN